MLEQEVLSIIVPVYKVEPYLRQCLDSIVGQTYQNIDVILIDDGSPDNCGAICDEYAARDERVVVIHKKNAGVSAARNDGIERAVGEWIMFVDPDDWLEMDCCEQVLKMARRENCDVVYFQHEINDENGVTLKRSPSMDSLPLTRKDLQELQRDAVAGYTGILGFESCVPWGKIYRRDFLIDHSCRFPVGIRKRQDVIFNLFCLESLDKAYYYDYIGYHYRQNENSISCAYNENMLDILLAFYGKVEEFVIKYHKDDEEYARMLGVLAIKIFDDLQRAMFFHPDVHMKREGYCRYMEQYYGDRAIKQYIKKSNLNDFKTMKDKVRFILISKKHIYLYYYLKRTWIRFRGVK